jgi:hypothetical protein
LGWLRGAALWLIVLAGATGMAVFGGFAPVDWDALQAADARFEAVARGSPDVTALYLAESKQNLHRLNLFAEGVWALLSAILAAIGLHGLCAARHRDR